jgi:hypothetical protein
MIVIRRRQLRLLRSVGLVIGLLVLSCLGFYLLGRSVTPIDTRGRPIILSPSLVAARQYQTAVIDWDLRLRAVDQALAAAINGQDYDLYAASEAVAAQVDQLSAILDEISLTSPPPPLVGLHDLASTAAESYREAANRIASFLAQPSAERQSDAAQVLRASRAYLSALEDSPWLKNRY